MQVSRILSKPSGHDALSRFLAARSGEARQINNDFSTAGFILALYAGKGPRMGDVLAERPRFALRRRATVSFRSGGLLLSSGRKLRWLIWIGVAGLTGWGAILEANSGFV